MSVSQTIVTLFKQQGLEVEHLSEEFMNYIHEFLYNFLAKETRRAYVNDLKAFFTFIRDSQIMIHGPQDISAESFRHYRDYLIQIDYSPATIHRKLVAIRSFIKWAVATRLLDHNPLDALKLPRIETLKPTTALTDQEALSLINAPDISTREGNTHRMIMCLLFNLGLRRSECTQIQKKDIYQDRQHTVLIIRGKGGKQRRLPLNKDVLSEIKDYQDRLFNLTALVLEPDDYLIQTRGKNKNTKPADGSTLYRIIKKYAQALGIEKAVSPHSCRATVISHLLDTQHCQIRDVADFAGHTNITTTERYDKKRKGLDENAAYAVNFKKLSSPNGS